LGNDYQNGADLIAQFRVAKIDYQPNSTLWNIDTAENSGYQLGVLKQGCNHFIHADKLLLATGPEERPMPFPGWQLPGVMTAGATQILLKSAATVPQSEVVLAGSGPLLLLLATQYLRAGVKIKALLDTTPSGTAFASLSHLPKALTASDYLIKGLLMMLKLRRARVPVFKRVTALKAEGYEKLERVTFSSKGVQETINAETLLIHNGVVPGVHLPQLASCIGTINNCAGKPK
jgi:NADPH-dependent 2,4-dienoyl-CoA reductase/sulfur reductase-like enzyme